MQEISKEIFTRPARSRYRDDRSYGYRYEITRQAGRDGFYDG